MEHRGNEQYRAKWRGQLLGITTTGPVIRVLVRQQRSHIRIAGFSSLLVQFTDASILPFMLKESWCFQRGLDWKMNGERKGPERVLGPAEECRESKSPF